MMKAIFKTGIAVSMFMSAQAFAGSVQVEPMGSQKLTRVQVTAKEVKAVEVTFKKVIKRQDCNRTVLETDAVRVAGNTSGNWYVTFYVSASAMTTEMYCPIQETITETIVSKPIVFESLTNRNLNGEVDITLLVPESVTVEAKEVK